MVTSLTLTQETEKDMMVRVHPPLPFIKIIKERFIMTKGKMIKALKEAGVRSGDKDGYTVPLEHLKTYQVIKMYYQYCID